MDEIRLDLREENKERNIEIRRTNDLLFEINKLNKFDEKRDELIKKLFCW